MSKASGRLNALDRKAVLQGNASATERRNLLGEHLCIHREASGSGVRPHALSLVPEALKSPGEPLNAGTRAFMDSRFGRDFSNVRVHTDGQATESARALGANAYTVGNHIVFAPSRFAPHTQDGQRLLAHELTHVAQNDRMGGPSPQRGNLVSHPTDPSEREAVATAHQVVKGEPTHIAHASQAVLQADSGGVGLGVGIGLGAIGAGLGIAALAGAFNAKDPTVDRIDVIDSPAGAIHGFDPIYTGNLDTPGPWNDPASGGVSSALQIHFHLDQGDSAALTPRRELQRSAFHAGVESKNPPDRPAPAGSKAPPTPGGFKGVIVGPDGPAAHEIKRPSGDKIVVADAPGSASLDAANFPFIYQSHFKVTVANAKGADVASIRYDVEIEKKSATDIPNTKNAVTPVEKRDLIRGKAL